MIDAFVSYSRHDSELVGRLHRELETRGIDVWVDWEDIPPTADWFERISSGIRDAGTFVFVISPASLASEVCARELEYAIETGKRVLPILGAEVGDLVIPASIAKVQWISLLEWTPRRIEEIAHAIEVDPERVAEHTKWLQLSDLWEKSSRDKGSLLRGSELVAAEKWIAREEGSAGDLQPTTAHYELILASRVGETKRQRKVRLATTAALVISLALAAFALIQRSSAISERETATARALSANAFLNLPTDPELSLLLARESLDEKVTEAGEDALRQALIASRLRSTLTGHSEPLSDLAFSPDGKIVATASEDKTARLWSADTSEEIATLKGHETGITQIDFDQTGSVVATSAQDGTVRVWESSSGESQHVFRTPSDYKITDFAFSPDSKMLATGSFPSGSVRIYDLDNGDLKTQLPVEVVDQVAFSPDSDVIAVASQTGPATLWNPENGALISQFTAGGPRQFSTDLAFSPLGDRLVLAFGGVSAENGSAVLTGSDGSIVTTLTHDDSVEDASFSQNGAFVATASDDSTSRIWDAESGDLLTTLSGHTGPVTSVDFSPDGNLVLTGSADGTARVWDRRSGRSIAELRGHKGSVSQATFSPDGETVATSGRDGSARLWAGSETGGAFDLIRSERGNLGVTSRNGAYAVQPVRGTLNVLDASTGAIRGVVPTAAFPIAVGGEGDLVVVPGRGGTTLLAEPDSNEEPAALDTSSAPDRASLSADDSLLALGSNLGYLGVWDTESRTEIAEISPAVRSKDYDVVERSEVPQHIELSPDGSKLLTSNFEGFEIRDVPSGERLQDVDAYEEEPVGMAFTTTASWSSDGSTIVTTAIFEDTARVWDADSGEELASLQGHAGGLFKGSFGADDAFVATGGIDGTVRIWETRTGRALGVLGSSQIGITDVVFADGGTVLHAQGDDFESYECTVCGSLDSLLRLSDERATRDLTPGEIRNFVEVPE